MLLNTHKKHTSAITFSQQLSYIKQHRSSTNPPSKNQQYFQSMNNVLDLLLNAYPTIAQQLMTLKLALRKWYDHLLEESNAKNRQMMEMRENLIIYVSKEVGVTLQEIGYYVKHLVQNYDDEDMRVLYAKYLQSIKKMQWDHHPVTIKHQSSQTNQQEPSSIFNTNLPTLKSIISHPNRPSEATIDSPHPGKYRDVDIHKYIQTKQENLQLERRINQFNARITDLEAENRNLKREVERLHDENTECRLDRQRELNEVAKLKQLLSTLKDEEEARLEREQQKINSFNRTQKKYDQCESIKNALHKSLEDAQNVLLQKQKANNLEEGEEFFNSNYHTVRNADFDSKYQTVKKEGRINEYAEVGSELRMLLIQALTIESFINDSSSNAEQ